MAVITVSRELGSNGKAIAAQVAEELGYVCFDKTLILELARQAEVSELEVSRYDEKLVNPIRQWLRELILQPWDTLVNPPVSMSFADTAGLSLLIPDEENALDSAAYHEFLERLLIRLWRRDDVVIVGRGAQRVLAGRSRTLHVRIVAPEELRCNRIMKRENIDRNASMAMIRRTDNARAKYFSRRFHMDWADPTLYNMTINTGMTRPEESCRIICDATRRMIASHRHQEEES